MGSTNQLVFVAATLFLAPVAMAEKRKSGPQAGETVTGYFDFMAEKCGGGQDRYQIGQNISYF